MAISEQMVLAAIFWTGFCLLQMHPQLAVHWVGVLPVSDIVN